MACSHKGGLDDAHIILSVFSIAIAKTAAPLGIFLEGQFYLNLSRPPLSNNLFS